MHVGIKGFTGSLCIAVISVLFPLFPPVAGVDVWLGIQIQNVLCSRHLLTFHFKESWPIFYFEAIPAHAERKPVANLDLLFMRVLYTKQEVEKD